MGSQRVRHNLATKPPPPQQNLPSFPFLSVQLSNVKYIHIVVFPSAELFESCDTETLSPLINNPLFCCPPAPDSHPSTFCLYEFYISPISGIIQYLHFCYWLISPGLMASSFIHVVACDISFYAWTTFAWASLTAQLVKNPPAMWETWVLVPGSFDPGKIPWRKERLPTPVFWPGKFHGLYSSWGHKESVTTGRLSLSLLLIHPSISGQ